MESDIGKTLCTLLTFYHTIVDFVRVLTRMHLMQTSANDTASSQQSPAVIFKSYDGPASLSPIPLTVSSPAIKPEDKRLITANALEAAHLQAEQQIGMLRRQAELLIEQARAIEARIQVSKKIYEADLGFQPVIHQTYYVYRRNNDTLFISMISYEEFAYRTDLHYLHTVRLLPDKTWDLLHTAEPIDIA
jgi:Protein of unknown function (DUF2452)